TTARPRRLAGALPAHVVAPPRRPRTPPRRDGGGRRPMKEGRLEQAGDRWQLHFTRRLPHPPEKVWRALTEPEHLKEWFPNDIEGERKEGATLRHVFRNDEAPDMAGEMRVYEPPSVLEFTWG